MQSTPHKELVYACLSGYVLWVFAYILFVMIALGIGPKYWFDMPFGLFCFGAMLFIILAFVALFFLFLYYRMVGAVCRGATRTEGELLYILTSGLLTSVLLLLLNAAQGWHALFSCWCFFSLPALFTVLCLRGWEWHRRHQMGQG